jgi:hypothetical protein
MHWTYVSLVLGVLLCLIDAFLMFEAHILGESARSWAPVIGIVGIGLIGLFGATGYASSLKPKN